MVRVMSEVKRFYAREIDRDEAFVECVLAAEFDGRDHAADVYFGSWKRTERELDAQRLRADTAEAELEVLRQQHAEQSCIFCNNSGELLSKVKAAEQRIADRDALLRSTSVRLWNAHLALNRLIELDPVHKVKLMTDTIFAISYAHKCIDTPHWDAALNQKSEGDSQ